MRRPGFLATQAACSACWLLAISTTAEVLPTFNRLAVAVDDGVAPLADVYELRLHNTTDVAINAITLDLPAADLGVSQWLVDSGGFLNPSDLDTFGGALPSFRGFAITDSFFVLPEGFGPLDVGSVFTSERLTSNYTTAGGTLVRAGEQAIVAHLSVPSGERLSLPADASVLGSVVFADLSSSPLGGRRVFPQDPIFPEPAGALLAFIATLAVGRQR